MTVCDLCIESAIDDGATDTKMAIQVCTNFGIELPDHLCAVTEGDEKECDCTCRSHR